VCRVIDSYEEDPEAPGERRLCSSTILPPLQISVTEEEQRLLRCVYIVLQTNENTCKTRTLPEIESLRESVYIHICVYTYMCVYMYVYIHYRSKVWDHLEMTLFFKEKHCFFNKDNIK